MPRFYLHVKHNADLIRGEEGIDLPTRAHARAQALQSARELWANAIKAGNDLRADAFLVADEYGNELAFVPFTEAIKRYSRELILFQHSTIVGTRAGPLG